MRNWLIFCLFIFCLAMTVLGIFVDLFYQIKFKPQIADFQLKQEKQLFQYLEDKVHFKNHPLFKPNPKNQRDFGPFFTKLSTNHNNTLVSNEVRVKLLSNPKNWLEKRHLVPPDEVIDRIFSQVHNFNYWSLDHATVQKLKISPTDFVVMAQIYLSNTFYQNPKHILISLEQVRNLSKILLSTELLNFKLAGLSLLEKEQHLIEFMNRRKVTSIFEWNLTPSKEINRFRLFLRQTTKYLNFLTPINIIEKVFLSNDLPPGVCAAINQRIKALSWTKLYLTGSFPFEPTVYSDIDLLQKINNSSQNHCQNLVTVEKIKAPISSHVPFYRRLYALNLLLKME